MYLVADTTNCFREPLITCTAPSAHRLRKV